MLLPALLLLFHRLRVFNHHIDTAALSLAADRAFPVCGGDGSVFGERHDGADTGVAVNADLSLLQLLLQLPRAAVAASGRWEPCRRTGARVCTRMPSPPAFLEIFGEELGRFLTPLSTIPEHKVAEEEDNDDGDEDNGDLKGGRGGSYVRAREKGDQVGGTRTINARVSPTPSSSLRSSSEILGSRSASGMDLRELMNPGGSLIVGCCRPIRAAQYE
jgi:hypothetical protein